MAIVLSFKGVHYDLRKVGDIGKVVTPPYDVISAEEQEIYYRRHEHNIIRLILGKIYPEDDGANNRYTRAAGLLHAWLQEGVLVQDSQPAFYLYRQEYILEGKSEVRRGMIGLVRLEEFDRGVILPHEKTLTAPKVDRLSLLRACRANLSPVFGLYSDPTQKLSFLFAERETQEPPRYQLVDDKGIHHAFWPLFQQEAVKRIVSHFEDKQVLIADGHHRYETALQFQKEMRAGITGGIGKNPFDHVLMYLANMDEEGLSILPTHRLVRRDASPEGGVSPSLLERINRYFETLEFPFVPGTEGETNQRKALLSAMKEQGDGGHAFGLYGGGDRYYLLTLKDGGLPPVFLRGDLPESWRDLDVVILHIVLLEGILGIHPEEVRGQCLGYTQDPDQAASAVRSGEYQIAFFLNPTRIEEIKRVTASGQRMPEKSSYFYPKLLTGLTLHKF